MVQLVNKRRHKKGTCYNEIELCDQKIDTIVGSRVNTIKRTYVIT